MSWYKIFYWLTRADSIKDFFDSVSNIFVFFTFIFFIVLVITNIGKAIQISENNIEDEEEEKKDATIRAWELAKKYSTKLFYPFLIITLITWTVYVFIPTKKDCLLIIAGGAVGNFITSDSSAKQLPSDVTKFLHLSLKKETEDLSNEAKQELGISTPKETLLNKAKNMTKEEIINYLTEDTTIIKAK